MQKENLFFFSFSSESTFEVHLKGTNKRAKNQILFEFFSSGRLQRHTLYLQVRELSSFTKKVQIKNKTTKFFWIFREIVVSLQP